MNVLAIIPARGGSVRLPRKNLLPVGGVPLVVRAIRAAQGVKYITRIVVSTDDDEIAHVSRDAGAEILQRPPSLSGGNLAGPHILIEHVIDTLEKHSGGMFRAGVIVLLQPTSPLRSAEDINGALELYQSGDCDSVTSVCGGKENGAVYVTHASLVRRGSIYGLRMKWYEMPAEKSVDIDTLEDLERAEQILRGETGDNRGVLHQLANIGRGQANDKGGKRGRGRPRKVPTI